MSKARERKPTVVIAGGGTGGHIFPGLAVADAIRSLAPECDVVWLGGRRGQEGRLVTNHGLAIRYVAASRVMGGSLLARLQGIAAMMVGVVQATWFFARKRPVAVLGVGGYASAAGGLAARVLRIPLLIAEQNALPGRTNRALGRRAARIAVSFEEARASFPAGRTELTGNPVRADITNIQPVSAESDGPRRVLVFGGSQGARFLNENVPGLVARLAAEGVELDVRHQTGPVERDATAARYAEANLDAEVVPFIDDMAAAYGWSDIVVCRAGATTVAELGAAGRPALLVPFPFAADDHQAVNAKALVDTGAALMVRQENWDESALAEDLKVSLDGTRLAEMAQRAGSLARPDAAADVARMVLRHGGLLPNGQSPVDISGDGKSAA